VGLYVSSGVGVTYCSTSLLRELHARYLISTRLLTTWLADHLLVANLAQVGFIVQLIGSYVPDMTRHVVNGRICVRGACEKLHEVSYCVNEAE
jgi:mediator of RNA polymerase II transcription subunit 12